MDHEGLASHLTRSDCDRSKCCISKGMDGTVRSECENALTVKMETVTLISKGRKNLTCFVY